MKATYLAAAAFTSSCALLYLFLRLRKSNKPTNASSAKDEKPSLEVKQLNNKPEKNKKSKQDLQSKCNGNVVGDLSSPNSVKIENRCISKESTDKSKLQPHMNGQIPSITSNLNHKAGLEKNSRKIQTGFDEAASEIMKCSSKSRLENSCSSIGGSESTPMTTDMSVNSMPSSIDFCNLENSIQIKKEKCSKDGPHVAGTALKKSTRPCLNDDNSSVHMDAVVQEKTETSSQENASANPEEIISFNATNMKCFNVMNDFDKINEKTLESLKVDEVDRNSFVIGDRNEEPIQSCSLNIVYNALEKEETGVKDSVCNAKDSKIVCNITEEKAEIFDIIEDKKEVSDLTEDKKIVSSVTANKKVVASDVIEDKKEVAPSVTEDKKVAPSVTEDKKVAPSVTEDKKVAPSVTEDKKVAPFVTEDKKVAPSVTEDKKVAPSVTEDKNEASSVTEDKKIVSSVTEDKVVSSVTEDKNEVSDLTEDKKVVSDVTEDNTDIGDKKDVISEVTENKKDVISEVTENKKDVISEVTENKKDVISEVTENKKEIVSSVTEDKKVAFHVTKDTKEVVFDVTKDTKEVVFDVTEDKKVVSDVTEDKNEVSSVAEDKKEISDVTEDKKVISDVTEDEKAVDCDIIEHEKDYGIIEDLTLEKREITIEKNNVMDNNLTDKISLNEDKTKTLSSEMTDSEQKSEQLLETKLDNNLNVDINHSQSLKSQVEDSSLVHNYSSDSNMTDLYLNNENANTKISPNFKSRENIQRLKNNFNKVQKNSSTSADESSSYSQSNSDYEKDYSSHSDSVSLISQHSMDSGESLEVDPMTVFSTSAQPVAAPLPETALMYQFEIHQNYVGRLIGKKGTFVKRVKSRTCATIIIQDHPNDSFKLVTLQGTKYEIQHALEMIRDQFPKHTYRDLSLARVNDDVVHSNKTPQFDRTHHKISLPTGVLVEVRVSHIANAVEVWLQQPLHPTYSALSRLQVCLNNNYSENSNIPGLPEPVEDSVICVCNISNQWQRCQVVQTDGPNCVITLLDNGGCVVMPTSALKQIRTDYMSLPFQADQCYLYGLQPRNDSNQQPAEEIKEAVLETLMQGKLVAASVVAYTPDGIPCVNLYYREFNEYVCINQKLVEFGLATWIPEDLQIGST